MIRLASAAGTTSPLSTSSYSFFSSSSSSSCVVQGWVRTVRVQKNVAFAEICNGLSPNGVQAVISAQQAAKLKLGSSVRMMGQMMASPGKNQCTELVVESCEVLGPIISSTTRGQSVGGGGVGGVGGVGGGLGIVDNQLLASHAETPETPNIPPASVSTSSSYPLVKSSVSFDHLRDHLHLRSRTRTFGGMWRLRNASTMLFHNYFQKNGFIQIHAPVLTSSDCEGGGEAFKITTPPHHTTSSFSSSSSTTTNNGTTAPSIPEFFGHPTYLTVSSQLHLEAIAASIARVYSFGPTFRAEKSSTSRHLAEFWMIEGEVAFIESLPALLDIIEQSIKHNLNGLLLNNNTSNNNHTQRSPILKDLDFLLKSFKSTTQTSTSVIDAHLAQLESFASQRFQRMTYTEAVKTLRAAPSKIRKKWSFPVEWGLSLQTEHERFLADQVIKGPVFVTDYPAKIKPFYMRQNGDADGDVERETVACCDLLVPGVGELVGGSLREERLEKLTENMRHHGLITTDGTSNSDYEWYLDLRRFGTVPHGGWGLGFERYLQMITGAHTIKDCIPFPRWTGRCMH